MATDVEREAARQLAEFLDQRLVTAWSTKPQLAVMRAGDASASSITIIPIDEPATSTLNGLPGPERVVDAVALSALGRASTSELDDAVRVRVTIAASCCGVFAIVRSAGTRRDSCSVDGELVADLRAWARLDRCTCQAA